MNKIFIFSIGIAAILYVGTLNFSLQSIMSFPQNSNPKMMMGQAMMMPCMMMGPMMGMGQMNQTGIMGMQ